MAVRKAIITGGGIGGLTLAGALTRRGIDVTVLERAEAVRARGLGFTVWPNATAALHSAGLLDAVRKVAEPITSATLRVNSGRKLTVIDMKGWGERVGFPALSVTRPELLTVLADACGAHIRFGSEVASVTPRGAVRLTTGEELRADVVVGADGVGSAVRRSLLPAHQNKLDQPMITGWQGVVPRPWPAGIALDMIFGPTGAAGILGLPGDRTYWFLQAPTVRMPADGSPYTEGWSPVIKELVAATPRDSLWRDDIRDRKPVADWGRGAVTLLGDAAHTIMPNLGQGACLAMEDAAVLAVRLADAAETSAALRDYEKARFPRVRDMYVNARRAARMQRLTPLVRDGLLSVAPFALSRMFTSPGRPIPVLAP
ncbi:FAD-dependent monooxygenase [Streptomyces sp. NPDC018584]|uniref:FAD-dependent monooxygenase n=1 Tax=unclassified Streptomyces TaxID=2593676 RepID=UPI00378D16DC